MTYLSKRLHSARLGLSSSTSAPAIRLLIHGFLIATILLVNGCGKSPTNSSTPDTGNTSNPSTINHQPSTSATPSFRLHWVGKKRLTAESNATNFVSIWNMPESLRLESQTLDKLSTAPWRLLTAATPLSNAPTALLRSLLDDLVQEETYLEIVAGTNQPAESVLAVKLPPERAALWQTNLPIILKSIYGEASETKAPAAGYQLSTKDHQITLTFTNGWTILSSATLNHPSRQTPAPADQQSTDGPISVIQKRIAATGIPFVHGGTNHWVAGRVDFSWLSRAVGWHRQSNSNLPACEFSIAGDAGNVRTFAHLTFPSGAPFELEPWNVPTNLVHDPLSGFMAVRGIRPALQSYRLWSESKFGDTPNQGFFWSQSGNPALRFFAFPSRNSSNQMHLLSQFLLNDINPIMAVFPNTTNVPMGSFEPTPDSQRLRWRGIPYIIPNLDTAGGDSNPFIAGGLFQNRITNSPTPDALLGQLKNDSNIILYDWESSKTTSFTWIQVAQTARFVFGLNRFSLTNNPALPWIVAVSPKLDASGTTIRLTSTNTMSLTRSSTLGLTGLEIHLLADWLESPDFPKGTFTLNSPVRPSVPPRPSSTASP